MEGKRGILRRATESEPPTAIAQAGREQRKGGRGGSRFTTRVAGKEEGKEEGGEGDNHEECEPHEGDEGENNKNQKKEGDEKRCTCAKTGGPKFVIFCESGHVSTSHQDKHVFFIYYYYFYF